MTFHLFAGPCVIESKGHSLEMAHKLKEIVDNYPNIKFYFKSSFDKANRSSPDSFRGPGLQNGLKILEEAKKIAPVITDFHEAATADEVASVVDVLQVPAFLCRQTDLIVEGAKACAKYKRKFNVKKGQFLSAYELKNVVDKVTPFLDIKDLFLTERGNSFGYNNLVVDMTGFSIINDMGAISIFDATHSLQLPGIGKTSGGKREFAIPLARAGVAAFAKGLFMEVHDNPSMAKSDASTVLSLELFTKLLESVYPVILLNSSPS